MNKAFVLANQQARNNCSSFAQEAPEGWRVVFSEPKRKDIQSDKFHAMIGDIAKQVDLIGRRWNKEDAKRLLIDAFAAAMREAGTPLHHDGRVVPSLDGKRVVQLGIQSKDFRVAEACVFIEYLYAFGTEHDVRWTEKYEIPEQYREAA